MGIQFADVIVDLQYGDTGKGKIANHLARTKFYDFVLRYNGGSNAGHTVYHNNVKLVTHQIPVGVLHGVKSIIGPGCVVNINKLHEEIEMLKSNNISIKGFLYVDKRAHVVTQKHLDQDSDDTEIGTTKQGIGPAYTDKYARKGLRIGDIDLSETLPDVIVTDVYDLFFTDPAEYTILCEGAQGFYLDVDWGNYPYVTSSHCTVGSVLLNGIPFYKIRKVYGIMKAYETYVGNNESYSDPNDPILNEIQETGAEFGATTGRRRKVNWMNINNVIRAMHINGVTDIIINKIDVLEEVGHFAVIAEDNKPIHFSNSEAFSKFVESSLREESNYELKIIWSRSPNTI